MFYGKYLQVGPREDFPLNREPAPGNHIVCAKLDKSCCHLHGCLQLYGLIFQVQSYSGFASDKMCIFPVL